MKSIDQIATKTRATSKEILEYLRENHTIGKEWYYDGKKPVVRVDIAIIVKEYFNNKRG